MCSDAMAIKEIDDVIFEIQAKTILVDDSGIDIGANPSAEGGEDEPVDESVRRVVNIVHNHQLSETSYDKSSFMMWLKNYLKKVKDLLTQEKPDRVDPFMKGMQKFVKEQLLPKFNDLQFWTGASLDPEAAMAFSFYEGESTDPTFWFIKDGLKEVKV